MQLCLEDMILFNLFRGGNDNVIPNLRRHGRLATSRWVRFLSVLVVMNEIARRTKAGGIFCFFVLPAALTVYFIAIYIGAAKGADWALQNDTYVHMNSWFHYAKLYAATAGCIGFMMLKYKWGIGQKRLV